MCRMKRICKWLQKIFKKKPYIKENPVEFVNNNMWGDSILIDKANDYYYIKGHGFKPVYLFQKPIEVGDLFIVDMTSGQKAVYVFTEIRRVKDPKDMFFFKAEFLKYKGE